jgi:hypothetical protein
MAPEQIIAAAMQRPGQSQEEVRRQLMHEHLLLTNTEIDRLLGALREDGSTDPVDAEIPAYVSRRRRLTPQS